MFFYFFISISIRSNIFLYDSSAERGLCGAMLLALAAAAAPTEVMLGLRGCLRRAAACSLLRALGREVWIVGALFLSTSRLRRFQGEGGGGAAGVVVVPFRGFVVWFRGSYFFCRHWSGTSC